MTDFTSPATYPMGATVTFADHGAIAQDETEPVVATGTVNATPLDDENGTVTHVRVWAARDHGRESTTIIVAVANVLDVTPPVRS